ncbi:CHAT domain-containing protein [Sinorhizobium meliloti]|uniref:CHAT domain-containing protein n=1 Tax=Rhizobium meliloti TaxID=382 RepID=UPI0012977B87|nr:CHAT domain-containing protein [Sinorhizobium meliloti]
MADNERAVDGKNAPGCREAAGPRVANRGFAFEKLDADSAIRICLRELSQRRDEPELLAYLARAYAKAGRYPEMRRAAERSAAAGNPVGQWFMGVIYDFGFGVAEDDAAAVRWYHLAADQGHAFAQNSLGVMYDHGRGVPQSDTEAVRWYRLAADQGNADAQFNLGLMYDHGRGVPQSDTEAVRWYRLAADQGDAAAQNNLGAMYADGRGVPQSDTEAVRWYRLAADQGTASAQFNLGFMYRDGRAVPQSDTEAVRWYRLAADQGDADAQFNLGVMYDHGRGVPQSDMEAVRWYRLAADQGNADAQYNLGVMYDHGRGVPQSDTEAVRWYRLAADQGHSFARVNLGVMHAEGSGVPQSDTKAVHWYRLAADQGNANAQTLLGVMYDTGRSVPQSDTEAVRWYRLAADQGYANAQFNLGLMYSEGRGVPQSDTEAVRWYRLAADQGNASAQFNVGVMYANGRGVPKSDTEAVHWYRLAADQGDADAQNCLGNIYAAGLGVLQSDKEALRWYRLAADQGNAHAQTALGHLYAKGHGVAKSETEAVRWYRHAADQANAEGQVNLGMMYLHGQGVAHNEAEAIRLFRLAADQGSATAQFHLGVMYDEGRGVPQSDVEAVRWYRMAADQGNASAQTNLAFMFAEGSGISQSDTEAVRLFITAAKGGSNEARERLLRGLSNSGDPLHRVMQSSDYRPALSQAAFLSGVSFEETLFDCYSVLSDCGEATRRLDLAEAARWYRIAGADNVEALFRLGRLLINHPTEENVPGEGLAALAEAARKGSEPALFLLTTLPLAEVPNTERDGFVMERLSSFNPQVAAGLAFSGATGRFGDLLVASAYRYLESTAASGDPIANAALVNVALFYGAYERAAELLEALPEHLEIDLEGWDYTIDRLLSLWILETEKGFKPDSRLRAQLKLLLDLMTNRGSKRAEQLGLKFLAVERLLIQQQEQPNPAPSEPDRLSPTEQERYIAAIVARIGEKEKEAGLSPILVHLYHSLARSQASIGQGSDAEASVLKATSIAESINRQSRHLKGSLVYNLERSCILQRSSQVLFELGRSETALAFAKESVNSLQAARRALLGLPQGLQGCFRDLVGEQYRALADLFISQGHYDEAKWVLNELKDFETYEYGRNRPPSVGAAFDALPQSARQKSVIAQLYGLPIAEVYRLNARKAELQAITTETARSELAQIEQQLSEARRQLRASLQVLQASVETLETEGFRIDYAADDFSTPALLEWRGNLQELENNTALIYTVVLPDKVHILVTVADATQHIELAIAEDELNRLIVQFRQALQTEGLDPRKEASKLYALLWGPVERALDAAKVEDVLLSIDRRLRYIPFPALHDGQQYLVEKRRYAILTSDSRDSVVASGEFDQLSIQGLGATRGGSGFAPLPGVADEIRSIVKQGDEGPGLVPGQARLDDAFDRAGLAAALASGAPIIHLATHFDLQDREETSRILLGTRKVLTVADLIRATDDEEFAFSRIKMLVLSACQTAFNNGHELESLAATLQGYGVKTVVATLWPVADKSTAEFMERFYSHLTQGAGRGEALRLAQIDFIRSLQGVTSTRSDKPARGAKSLGSADEASKFQGYSHPRHWAAFTLMGQWK